MVKPTVVWKRKTEIRRLKSGTFDYPSNAVAAITATDECAREGLKNAVYRRAPTEMVDYMKQNAPWTDRTGKARKGLRATGSEMHNMWFVTLYHTVYYGVFLEYSNNGRFAIVGPTMFRYRKKLLTIVNQEIRRAMRG